VRARISSIKDVVTLVAMLHGFVTMTTHHYRRLVTATVGIDGLWLWGLASKFVRCQQLL